MRKNKYQLKLFWLALIGSVGFWVLTAPSVQAADPESGTFVSEVKDMTWPVNFGTITWSDTVPLNTSLTMEARAGNVADVSDGTWTAVNKGDALNANFDGRRYIQYRATLATTNSDNVPSLDDVTVSAWVGTLTSSPYNSKNFGNVWDSFTWTETNPGVSDMYFQVRTSVDNVTWSNWCGPDNGAAGCDTATYFSNPAGSAIDADFKDGNNDMWAQYKVILVADYNNGDTPVLNDATFNYTTTPYEGTFVSEVRDTGQGSRFTTITWTDDTASLNIANPLAQTTTAMRVRAGNVAVPDGTWTSWSAATNGGSIAGLAGNRYIQYESTIATLDSSVMPSLNDVAINYEYYPSGASQIISSPYNSGSWANLLSQIQWAETTPANTNVKFQLRSAPDNAGSPDWANGSGWCGPTNCAATKNDTDYSSDYYETTPSGENTNPVHINGGNDQWMQYVVWLETTNSGQAPTLSDVTLTYLVNANPNLDPTYGTGGVTINQISNSADPNWGKVKIDYSIRDIDTTKGTFTKDYVTPTFEYSLNGTDYTSVHLDDITFGTAPVGGEIIDDNSDGKLDNKVEETNYLTYTAYWDAKTQIPENSSNTFKIRVTIDDNEGANRYGIAVGNTTTLDVKNPSVGAQPILVNGKINTNNLTLSATDDSTLQMETNLNNTFANILTTSYTTPTTLALESNPDTAYVKYQDNYGNTTTTYSATTPISPIELMVQDTSNLNTTPDEYRLFLAWKTADITTPAFSKYTIYKSDDNVTFSELTEISNRTTNYYTDLAVNLDTKYYYKLTTTDTSGNISIYSATVIGKANGTQDAGEGGGGVESTPPVISNVHLDSRTTTSAIIHWTTDELATSTVGYSTTPAVFTDEVGVDGYVTDHSVALTGLTPETTYYYQIKSADAIPNQTSDKNGTNGYTFTTNSGPNITNVAIQEVSNHSLTINWETNLNSDTYVSFTNTVDGNGNPINFQTTGNDTDVTHHAFTLTGLTENSTYYFSVRSTDTENNVATNNNGGSYYQAVTLNDNTPPVISNVDEVLLKDDSVAIRWITDEPSTSQVSYSTTAGGPYTDTAISATYNQENYVILNTLTVDTQYFYRVKAQDINGNNITSAEYDFTTEKSAEFQHPPLSEITDISDPPSVITDTKAVITFNTDQAANCYIEYGTEIGNYSEVPFVENDYNQNHSIHLTGLIFSTIYYYQITCEDNLGNAVSSIEYNFTTSEKLYTQSGVDALGDNVAPSISGVKTGTITGESVTVTWTTDEEANSSVAFGIVSGTYENGAINDLVNSDIANYVTAHSIIINNLTPSTKYFYIARSIDAFGNIGQSAEESFTTASPSSLSSINIVSTSLNSATISWTTTQTMTSIVEYGLTVDYGDIKQSNTMSKVHQVELSGLKTAALYHFRVKGKDADNNLFSSGDYTFQPKSPPKILSNKIESVNEQGATIVFATDIPTSSLIAFTNTSDSTDSGSQGKPELATQHSIELKNLKSGVTYALKLTVVDEQGNQTTEDLASFLTQKDENAPEIEQVKTDSALAQNDKVQTIISWTTNEPATTAFFYKEGVSGDFKEVVISEAYTTNHVVVATIFKPGTVYHFKVKSVDQSGNEQITSDFALLTPRKKENIVQIIVANFEDIFSWARLIK